jgi:hypothetical protein
MKRVLSQLFGSSRKLPRRAGFGYASPGLENLEGRCVPASIFVQPERTEQGGLINDLHIVGTESNDTIVIRENHNSGGEIKVFDSLVLKAHFPSASIQKITANLFGGADTFEYHLDSVYRNYKLFSVDLGAGNDVANFYMNNEIRNTLAIAVNGGSGDDIVWSQFGKVNNATMSFGVDLGAGDDRFAMSLAGDLVANAHVIVSVMGKAGNETLAVDAPYLRSGKETLSVDRSASLEVYLGGGTENDSLWFQYKGRNQGKILVTLNGEEGYNYGHSAGIDNASLLNIQEYR